MSKFNNPSNGCGHKRFSLEAGTIFWQVFADSEVVGYVTRSKDGFPYLYESFNLEDRSFGVSFSLFDARIVVETRNAVCA